MHRLQPRDTERLRVTIANATRRSCELRWLHRVHVVALVGLGRSCAEVAQWFGENPRTVQRWVHCYEQHGDKGLRDMRRSGRPARMTEAQQAQLASELALAPKAAGFAVTRWSGKLLALHLERRYGVTLSLRHCQRLIRRLER